MDYRTQTREARKKILSLIYKAQTSHIGSNFSAVDFMAVLFNRIDLDKDIIVLSAGWKAATLYYFLWKKGRITEEQLDSYCQEGSKFIGLAEPVIPDIKIAGGSMGLGFPGAVGLALAKKLKGEEGKVYCVMSDGEMQIGTTWESALIASHHKLDNLVVIVDYNKLQAMGKVEDILNIEPLAKKWESFGWTAKGIDGHDFRELEIYLSFAYPKDKPVIIICDTIKGKGVSFMENDNLFHYKAPNEKEYEEALRELHG